MDIKKAITKIFKIFVPVSLVVGSLIFSLSNVKDFKPVRADSGYSLTIDGGSTIAFTQQDATTYTAEINENVRRNTRITFYDGPNEMVYSDTCYADYLDTTNNLYNGAIDLDGNGGYFYTKYGISSSTITLSIVNGKYSFYMTGCPAILKTNSIIGGYTTKLKEGTLYCLGTSSTSLVSTYNENDKYFKTSSGDQPFIFTVKETNGRWTFKLISTNKYLSSVTKNNMIFTDYPDTTFAFSSTDRLIDQNNLPLCTPGFPEKIYFQSFSIGYSPVRVYELKEVSSVKIADNFYTFDFNQIQVVDLYTTIRTMTVADGCEFGSSPEGFAYQIVYDEKQIATLLNNIVSVSNTGAFTIKMTHTETGAILYVPFIFYSGEISFESPITINSTDEISNLSPDSIIHSNYDYGIKFGFVSCDLDKLDNEHIGKDSGRYFQLFNALPIEGENPSINKITLNGDMISHLYCEFSNDSHFLASVQGKADSKSMFYDVAFVPKDGKNYKYFRLYTNSEQFGGIPVDIESISIYFGEDQAAVYAKSFNEDFCAVCELVVTGDKGLSDIISEWNIQKAAFIVLKEKSLDSANKLKAATYADEDQDIAEFALKYDYIYGKYHSSLDDFVERNPVKLSQGMNAYHSLSEKEDQSVLIIVVSASTILLISASSLLILLKKKKKH